MIRRGQVSLEFIFFTVMVLLLLTITFVFSSGTTADSINLKRKFEASNVCQHFSILISSVATAGNGTIVEYVLPTTVAGKDYNITVNGPSNRITIDFTTSIQACPVVTGNFTSVVVANKTGSIINTGEGVSFE